MSSTSESTKSGDPQKRSRRILVVNPNSTVRMTDALKPLCEGLSLNNTIFTFFTGPPDSPKSINDDEDCRRSARCCFPLLTPILPDHDAVIIACYSEHPLVSMLKNHCREKYGSDQGAANAWRNKAILGIFEASMMQSWGVLASVSTCFSGVDENGHGRLHRKWAIITTGKVWEDLLTDGVWRFFTGDPHHPRRLEGKPIAKFASVASTGLNAAELHDLPPEVVRKKLLEAAKKLLQKYLHDDAGEGKIGVMCLGCAGMVGLEEIIRQASTEVGYEPEELRIVDGVKSGVLILDGIWREIQNGPA